VWVGVCAFWWLAIFTFEWFWLHSHM